MQNWIYDNKIVIGLSNKISGLASVAAFFIDMTSLFASNKGVKLE